MKPVTLTTATVGYKPSEVHQLGHAGVRWNSLSLVVNPTGFMNKTDSRIKR